jgi:hypothetical protein
MKMEIFKIRDWAKPDTENSRGLNLAAVKRTTVQVTKLPLWRKLLKLRHNLLFKAWTDRDLVYIVNNVMYIITLGEV